MFEALMDWIMADVVRATKVAGLLLMMLVVLLGMALILAGLVMLARPWAPTTVDEQMPQLTEAERTVLYGSQSRETVLTEPMREGEWPTSGPGLSPLRRWWMSKTKR